MENPTGSIIRGINLHPSGHLPSSITTTTFDVIVIGGGPSGRELARRTAAAGLSSVIVEDELIGGDCHYWACIPSKALLLPGEAIGAAKQIRGSREKIHNDSPMIDVKAVFARRDQFVDNWIDQEMVEQSESQGIRVVRGRGTLVGKNNVRVTSRTGESVELSAKEAVVLATGSRARIPDILGLQDVPVWTSREATATNEVPQQLIIMGGGVVGCEMATFFGTITKVVLVTSSSELLAGFEPEAGRRVREALIAKGVNVLLATKIESFRKEASSSDFKAHLSTGATISASQVMLATGRQPNIDNIGLEQLGVVEHARLSVNDTLCVAETDWLYAIGDANGRSPLTHMGMYHARAAANTIIRRARGESVLPQPWDNVSATSDLQSRPQVVVTDPNVASVGLTVSQAKSRGYKIKEVTSTFQFPGAWLYADFHYDGWAQWVIDVDREVLLGATFVGRQAGDLLHASTVALVGQIKISKLWHAVASFPTMSQIYTDLLQASGY